MSAITAIENRISRDLIRRRELGASKLAVERLITAVSVVAVTGLFVMFFPALLWLLAIAVVVLCLGS